MEIKSRLNLTELFWEVDEFYQKFEAHWPQQPQLNDGNQPVFYRSRLSLSEVMTIVIACLRGWLAGGKTPWDGTTASNCI